MTVELFISILFICAVATSLGIEVVKETLSHFGVQYKSIVVASITAMIVGIGEAIAYFSVNGTPIAFMQIVYIICMGVANVIVSAIGYDKVKAFILALVGKADIEE